MQTQLKEDEIIRVPGVGNRGFREISRGVLAAIIEPRMTEMLQLAWTEMKKSTVFDSMGAGVVLTGGASMLTGLDELAEKVMGMPVRIGIPQASGGLVETVQSPIYATGVGLVYYAISTDKDKRTTPPTITIEWIKQRFKDFIDDFFG